MCIRDSYKYHVDRRVLGSKATLFLRQDAFPLTVVLAAARDDSERCFAGVPHEGDVTTMTTLQPVFVCSTLIVASFHCCDTPPPLHTATTIS